MITSEEGHDAEVGAARTLQKGQEISQSVSSHVLVVVVFASFFYLVKDGLGIFWRVDVYSLAPSLFHL